MKKKRWKERDCFILELVYNIYMNEEIKISQEELERSINDMLETPAEQTVRAKYIEARNAFHSIIIKNDIDETQEPFANIIKSDLELYNTLRETDRHESEGHEKQLREKRKDSKNRKETQQLPRKVNIPKTINKILIRKIMEVFYQERDTLMTWQPENKRNVAETLDHVQILIGFAKAMEQNPGALIQMTSELAPLAKNDVEIKFLIKNVKQCEKYLDYFGKELAQLADDRGPGNSERWIDIARRIGRALIQELNEMDR